MDRTAFNVRTVQLKSGQVTTNAAIFISVVQRDQILRILLQHRYCGLACIKLLSSLLIFHAIAECDIPASCWGPIEWSIDGRWLSSVARRRNLLIIYRPERYLFAIGFLIKLDGHRTACIYIFREHLNKQRTASILYDWNVLIIGGCRRKAQ